MTMNLISKTAQQFWFKFFKILWCWINSKFFAFFLSLSSTKFLISLNSQKQSKLFASLIKFFLQPWISKDFDLNFWLSRIQKNLSPSSVKRKNILIVYPKPEIVYPKPEILYKISSDWWLIDLLSQRSEFCSSNS